MFDLDKFISEKVIKRKESIFWDDVVVNYEKLSKSIFDKTVLVIGGAGSIGSSFIKSLLPFRPKSITVVDINENGLAELIRDIRSTENLFVPECFNTYPMDFSSDVFRKMFYLHRGFDIVANFSAHKHVRSEKDIFSIEALIANNLFNAKQLLDLLSVFPPDTFFCVSTDKAANPANIMGASKRIMEDLIFCYSENFPVKTARFANVAFSNGSLPAGFLSRIQKLQPISAPCDVKRFFVSPEESGQICLLACILGENRTIFFPKLTDAQTMTFDGIARYLLEEKGYKVLECSSDEEAIRKSIDLKNGSMLYPVHFSKSDTSGEKPFEEFVTENETSNYGMFKSLGVITGKEVPDIKRIEKLFLSLQIAFENEGTKKEDIVKILKDYLPSFQHIETGKSLDSKM